jgi:HMG (high mobility group) box
MLLVYIDDQELTTEEEIGLVCCRSEVTGAMATVKDEGTDSATVKLETSKATSLEKSKEQTPAAAARKPTKKKAKDKPKRPLSAYNFFFKEERGKILKVVLEEDKSLNNDPRADDYLDEAALIRLRKDSGKVSFEEMGKIIGHRWKNIDPERLAKYQDMATSDTDRYRKEMSTYNGRQEAKLRTEGLSSSGSGEQKSNEEAMFGAAMMSATAFAPVNMGMGAYPYAMDYGYQMYGYGGYPMADMVSMSSMGMDPSQVQYPATMYGMMGPGIQGMAGYSGQGADSMSGYTQQAPTGNSSQQQQQLQQQMYAQYPASGGSGWSG